MFIAPAAIAGIALFTFLGGQIVMRLWNWLAPALFGWRSIGFWQALGILVLCRILFGGLGIRGSDRGGMRRRMEEKMFERYGRMTPEERERFREGMRARCGLGPAAGAEH
ncbi:MAG: hypothetical protein JO041_07725 [Acidobacteria bacterium]|nr:hypothetical protein [Acidobacteriota bacterium]